MLLLEIGVSLSILTVVGLVLLKLSLNILHPRQLVLHQVLTDAYMTYERSLAERVPFDDLVATTSLWPQFPTTSAVTVELGRLHGNRVLTGRVTRTRIPDTNNYPIDGGDPTRTRDQAIAVNPAAMKVWRVQSVVTYSVGGRNYAKSRTVLRTQ